MKLSIIVPVLLVASLCFSACNDDDPYLTQADRLGIASVCTTNDDCPQPEDDSLPPQECLTQFSGGYCGLEGCVDNDDCPEGSACVAHEDGSNYCFRQCLDKAECNQNRPADLEANCSSNITFTDPRTNSKACVPPSG